MKTTIIIKDDGFVTMEKESASGLVTPKVTSLTSFVDALQYDNVAVDLPLLPNHIVKYNQLGNDIVVVLEYPASIIDSVEHCSSSFSNIPVPPSVWVFGLKRASDKTLSIKKTLVFALGPFGMLDAESTPLYFWPMPNYSDSYTSGICWGSDQNFVRVSSKMSIKNLESLNGIYYAAAGNNDLCLKVSDDCESDIEECYHSCYLPHISGRGDYPYAYLLKNDSFPSLNSAISSLMRQLQNY